MPSWLAQLIALLFRQVVDVAIEQAEKPQEVYVDKASEEDTEEYERIFGSQPVDTECDTETLTIVRR